MITIIGLPGVGKTRLAREVSALGSQSRREVWIDLGGEEARAEFCAPLLETLESTGEGRILLILDDAIPDDPTLRAAIPKLLERSELQLVVTSQAPLGLAGELILELGPLALPKARALYQAALGRSSAAKGFEDDDSLDGLMDAVDGIPLAIELAAALERLLPPRALRERLAKSYEILRTPEGRRRGSLVEALRHGWSLLGEEERRALAWASVFRGGIPLEAAERIFHWDEASGRTVHLIDSLRSQGFLRREEAETSTRLTLPNTLRGIAAAALRSSGEEEAAILSHAMDFATQARLQNEAFLGPKAKGAIRWFLRERDNLAAAHRNASSRDPAIALEAGLAFEPVIHLQLLKRTDLELVESILATARTVGNASKLVVALRHSGAAHAVLGQGELARLRLDEAVHLAKAQGTPLELGRAIVDLAAFVLLFERDFGRAREELDQALAIARDEGSSLLEGMALGRLGVLEGMCFNYPTAVNFLEEALTIFRQHGHRFQEGRTSGNLARALRGLGSIRLGRQANREALAIHRELGDWLAEANELQHQGGVELVLGNLEEAEDLTLRSMEHPQVQDHVRLRARSMGNLGLTALLRGEPRLAVQRLAESVAAFEAAHDHLPKAHYLAFFAAAAATLGRRQEAKESLYEAATILRDAKDPGNDEMLEVLEGVLAMAEANRLSANQLREASDERAAFARGRLEAAVAPPHGQKDFLSLAIRLLEKAVDGRTPEKPRNSEGVRIGPEGAWLEAADGKRVDLRRRTSLRRVLVALAEQRLNAPEFGSTCEELFAAAWPGQEIQRGSANARVYTAIWTLRSLGLPIVLTGKGEGYAIDPEVPLQRDS